MANKYPPKFFVKDPKQFASASAEYVLPEKDPRYREQLDAAAEQRKLFDVARRISAMDPPPHGWDQDKAIAHKIGVKQQSFSRWKRGHERMPDYKREEFKRLFAPSARAKIETEIEEEKQRARDQADGKKVAPRPQPEERGWVSGLVTADQLGRPTFPMMNTPPHRQPSLLPDVDEEYIPPPVSSEVQAVLDDVSRAAAAERRAVFGDDAPVTVSLTEKSGPGDPHGWDQVASGYCSDDPNDDDGSGGYIYIDLPDRWHEQVKARPDPDPDTLESWDFSVIGGRFVLAVLGTHDHVGPTLVTALRAMPTTLNVDGPHDWEWGAAEATVTYEDGSAVGLEWVESDPARASVIVGQHTVERIPIDRIGLHAEMGRSPKPWWPRSDRDLALDEKVRSWVEQGLVRPLPPIGEGD